MGWRVVQKCEPYITLVALILVTYHLTFLYIYIVLYYVFILMISDNDESFHSANESVTSLNESFCSIADTLGDSLRDIFKQQNNRLLNVCHLNAQSVPSHFNDLYEAFYDSNVHAVLISETWLKPQLLSTSYQLPGFVLIRNDRVGKGGGGVAIYLRSDFPYKIISSSSSNYSASAEFLFLEVCVRGAKIILGVVLLSPYC